MIPFQPTFTNSRFIHGETQQIDGEGRKCGKGKWLKSYRFAEPVFDALPAEVAAQLPE